MDKFEFRERVEDRLVELFELPLVLLVFVGDVLEGGVLPFS